MAKESLGAFAPRFHAAYSGGLRRKIGLTTTREGDDTLTQDLLKLMGEQKADFTLTFRRLSDAAADPSAIKAARSLFTDPAPLDAWAARWHARLAGEPATPEARRAAMRAVNPAFIPRNHLVEAALTAAIVRDDQGPFEEMLTVLSRPYEDQPGFERYALPPEPDEAVYQTFCGT